MGKDNVPIGLLDENQMRELVASPYGRAVLLNESAKQPKVKKYVQKCGMADIHTDMEQLIECFANYKEAKGVIITENMEYCGFLSASDIIGIINERNLASARDQNPLTNMPGNQQIDRYVNEIVSGNEDVLFCYFDLNQFKAYNDTYGFRNGDRVIQLFARIMQKELPRECFKGHIGGDDFFAGITLKDREFMTGITYIKKVMNNFKLEVQSMYDSTDRERGYIVAKNREGNPCYFALLSASAVIVQHNRKSRRRAVDLLHQHFAAQKKTAKFSEDSMNISTLM